VLVRLDHVNIRTAHVDRLVAFYCEMLGMEPGPRPAFPFGGAWLYCGGQAAVHLVDAGGDPPHAYDPAELGLSHFAFSATGMPALIARLRAAKVAFQVAQLPGGRLTQVNLRDPDGNALHVDFAEEADLREGVAL
jgi:catechol 2,3-dioxygenase-like lactoylglutathione lyase family enzyme